MQNADSTVATLRELKDLGVRVAIDDFGIGHSSLGYLKRLPIDCLKIDQSFVRDITTDPDDAAIATAVIALAHTLKLTVVAEGVETTEQLAFLRDRRCDRMQGHLLSLPLPADACLAFLDRMGGPAEAPPDPIDEAPDSRSGGRTAVADGVLDLIGTTPDAATQPATAVRWCALYAKLEYLNPGGSVKDRAALGMIDAAEASGRLQPGATIIEPTAGNTGVGLALVGISRGYRVIVVVPEKFVGAKTAVMNALGAEIILTPTEGGIQVAIDKAREIARAIPNSFVPQQFENPDNPAFHYRTTAVEIHEQLGRLPDAVVLGAGTGGTFTGVVRYFKERSPAVRGILVEPQGSIWGGGQPGPHKVEGIGNSFWPAALDRSLVDEVRTVPDDPSFAAVKELARREGLLVGGSSGSAAHAAREVAASLPPDAVVVTLFPDGFERYLGKGVFENL
jgi:cysteine synthase